MPKSLQSWRVVFLAIFILGIFLPQFSVKSEGNCEPGTKCSFPLATAGSACRTNENVFFGKVSFWEIPANGLDYFNYRFGPFNSSGGYVIAGNIPGGCVCDVATWINYVLKVNGYSTTPSAKYHTAYNIAGVPNVIDTDGKHKYFVSIEHNNAKPEPGPNGEPRKWDADMRVDNHLNTPLIVRWQIVGDRVEIWLENATPQPTTTPTQSLPPLDIEQDFSAENQAPLTLTSPNNGWQTPLQWILGALILFFILGMILSEPFRRGAVPVLLVTVLVILIALIFLPYIMP